MYRLFFLYLLYSFVWIKHSWLTNMDSALDLGSNVTNRFWCISVKMKVPLVKKTGREGQEPNEGRQSINLHV